MKVQLSLDVDERTRYVIAKYFAAAGDSKDKARTRATRAQVRRFAAAALQVAIKERAASLHRRQRATADRLGNPAPEPEEVDHSWEWQGMLPL